MVQDTFISCAETDPEKIENHRAWLTKVCARKSLDLLKSAHKNREMYPGVWLPDAVPDLFQYWGNLEEGVSPEKTMLNRESFTTSSLLMLQKLSPEERVTWIMSDIFDYTFREISEILSKSEDACKKLAQRARDAFHSEKRFMPFSEENLNVVKKFYDVAKTGDAEELKKMFAVGAEMWSDGGGKVAVASKQVITDLTRMARFIAGIWSSHVINNPSVKLEYITVNSMPGQIVSRQGEDGSWFLETVTSFEIVDGKIARIYSQRNPDKLANILSE